MRVLQYTARLLQPQMSQFPPPYSPSAYGYAPTPSAPPPPPPPQAYVPHAAMAVGPILGSPVAQPTMQTFPLSPTPAKADTEQLER
jgi:hypothetical protein